MEVAETTTVVVACLALPPTVVQPKTKSVVVASGGEIAAPETLVFVAFWSVKSLSVGLEITHDCMPLVTHPMVELACGAIVRGVATRTIDARPTWMLHCAFAVSP